MNQLAQPTLYLMLGYPGAGKTTTAEIIAKLTGAVHLASDRLRLEMFPKPQFSEAEHQAVYDEINKRTSELLASGQSVIYDANLNRYEYRQEKYEICERTKAQSMLIWVKVEKPIAKKRATEEADNDHRRIYGNLQVQTFERLVNEIEPPRPSEAAIELDGTKISEAYVKAALKL